MKIKQKKGNGVQHTLDVSVPSQWEVVPLENVLDRIVGGGTPPKAHTSYWEGSIPWLSVKDMRTRRPEDAIDHISDSAVLASATNVIPADTVIIATRIGLGKVIRVSYDAAINQDLKALINKPEIDKGYLEYWIVSIADYLESIGSGTTVKGIRLEQLRSLPFPLAPLNEQKRIAEEIEKQFSRLDAAVGNLKRVKANLKRYKASILKAAVEGKLTEEWRKANPDVESVDKLLERILVERRKKWEEAELAKMRAKGKISKGNKWKKKYKEPIEPGLNEYPYLPEGWCWATIEQLASDQPRSIQSGPFGSNLLHSEFQTEGKLVVGIDNVQDGYFSMGSQNRISGAKFKELEKYAARPGDVLITVMATIGRTCVIPDNIEPAIITKHIYRISPNTEIVMPNFLHLAIWGGAFVREQIFGQVIGQTRPGLNGTIIKRLAIPVPTLKEQAQILKVIQESLSIFDKLIPEVDKAEMRSERLRQSILKKAFSGKLVSADPADEPASILLETIQKGHKDLPQRRKPSKTTRRRKMMKVNIESIRKVIEQFPKDIFTFDELRSKVSTDYDTLKEILFTLLEGENPPLKQIFDEATLQIQFIRVKK